MSTSLQSSVPSVRRVATALYLANGDTSGAGVHWEAVTNPPPLDYALRDLADALRWLRGPADEFREQAVHPARIVRTVSVR